MKPAADSLGGGRRQELSSSNRSNQGVATRRPDPAADRSEADRKRAKDGRVGRRLRDRGERQASAVVQREVAEVHRRLSIRSGRASVRRDELVEFELGRTRDRNGSQDSNARTEVSSTEIFASVLNDGLVDMPSLMATGLRRPVCDWLNMSAVRVLRLFDNICCDPVLPEV